MNIVPFPTNDEAPSVADDLRELADIIEGGGHGDVSTFLAIMIADGRMIIRCVGGKEDPLRTVGLLHIAQDAVANYAAD